MAKKGRRMGRKYSYADQKNHQHRLLWIILGILAFFIIYSVFSTLAFSMWVLENGSMAPSLHPGDRFIVSSYAIYSYIPGFILERRNPPVPRGSIVLVDMNKGEKPHFFYRILDSVVRFFTAQRVNLLAEKDYLFMKRVIGLPGDEISMTNYVVRVRIKGSAYNLTEFELTEQDYTPDIPQMPALWDSSIPFSGNMDLTILGENEYFVLSDDRSNTNDSRTWGPVSLGSITGRAIFRYWPLTRLGRP